MWILIFKFRLPHCHLQAPFFPKDFKGKIIHVTRDPRAIAASAYPFLGAIESQNHYYNTWGFKNVDDFAAHFAKGHMYWGNVNDYDNRWKAKAAQEKDLKIIFLKFEEIIA